MDSEMVISKKAVAELEQMFEDKGYSKFALHDDARHLTIEGRLGEILLEFIENTPLDNLVAEIECVSSWGASDNEFTALNFIVDISSKSGPNVMEMGIHKHSQYLSVAKSFFIKSLDDIPTKERATKEAEALFKYVSKQKKCIKM